MNLLANSNLLGDWHGTVGALVADNGVWVTQRLRLTNGQGPWRRTRNKKVRVHRSQDCWRAVTLEKRTRSDWAYRRFWVWKSIWRKHWACGSQGQIVIINLVGNGSCGKMCAVCYLGNLPVILSNFWAICILALDADSLNKTGINVLFRSNFTGRRIYY